MAIGNSKSIWKGMATYASASSAGPIKGTAMAKTINTRATISSAGITRISSTSNRAFILVASLFLVRGDFGLPHSTLTQIREKADVTSFYEVPSAEKV